MDFLSSEPQFSNLSLLDLLNARDQFHAHLVHKANVVGTAIGRYLIRKSDPYPQKDGQGHGAQRRPKPARTLENSEVRDYSWPCVLVFVSRWADEGAFGAGGRYQPSDFVPKTIYLEGGRSVPVCVVQAPLTEEAPAPLDLETLVFPDQLAGGYPVLVRSQGATHLASIGCLLSDGHTVYALTSRHVAGRPNQQIHTLINGKEVFIGTSSVKQLGKMAFEEVYPSWPGKEVFVNLDVGLIELDDQTRWSPSIYGVGMVGPLADVSVYNLSLQIIGCPVRAYGCASGRLFGQVSALFYRYKSVGGFEYVADFLIGSRDEAPLSTRPGDSGTVWVVETDSPDQNLLPLAVQWGGTVFSQASSQLPFALATSLSTVCRQLDVDVFRSRALSQFDYWGAVGHYTIGALACEQVADADLRQLLTLNQDRISFAVANLGTGVNSNAVPGFVPLADVPDKVWKKPKSASAPYGRKGPENPNHYADIDFSPNGGASLSALTPDAASLSSATWRAYYQSIGWNAVSERGLLPFRVWQIYKAMVGFVVAGDVAHYLAAAGVLAHYVGDACQPLHGSYLDDGDPFRNPDGTPSAAMLAHGKGYAHGVHVAYEDDMVDAHVADILGGLPTLLNQSPAMPLVQGGQEAGYAIIELIRRSQGHIPPLDLVNAYGQLVTQGQESQAPSALWQQFGNATLTVMADGCCTLAMLWESAWVEGGGNAIVQSQLTAVSKNTLQSIYEDQTFVPSVPLGQIDQYL